MHLLLVTNLFPTPADPERGIFTLQLARHLQKYCKVTVVCPLPWFPKLSILKRFKKWSQFSDVPARYVIDGITVYSPKYPLLPKISENIHDRLMAIVLNSFIKKLHKELHFDLINSQWFYPDSVAIDTVAKQLQLPHIPTGLGCDVNIDMHENIKGRKIRKLLRSSPAITVVSNNLKQEIEQLNITNSPITVIPNGIDVDKFKLQDKSDCRKQLGIADSIKIILFVGRLSEEKNVTSLIEAMATISSKHHDAYLYLVGDGPEHEILANKTSSLNLEKKIKFIGKVDHNDVAKWMGACDLFCLPSLREGCPNVILEALGSGRPVIASHVGAIPDVVKPESGLLFNPNNIEDIIAAFNTAFNTTWDDIMINRSVEKLSWDNSAKHYFEVFNKVVTKRD